MILACERYRLNLFKFKVYKLKRDFILYIQAVKLMQSNKVATVFLILIGTLPLNIYPNLSRYFFRRFASKINLIYDNPNILIIIVKLDERSYIIRDLLCSFFSS